MNATGGGVLEVVERMPLDRLPHRYRDAMRRYLGEGVLPESELRLLLEGDPAAAGHRAAPRRGGGRLSEIWLAQRWLDEHLPPCCWGNRDQVQLWIVYVRRARGRAMLAAFEEGNDGDASAEAAP